MPSGAAPTGASMLHKPLLILGGILKTVSYMLDEKKESPTEYTENRAYSILLV